ncbi:Hypothetical protein bglu_2g19130 [Burkholderia glumae BGR1]|nr:Hypothetical protein bglu_2g19130 [Burkholderia glumae BGR1]
MVIEGLAASFRITDQSTPALRSPRCVDGHGQRVTARSRAAVSRRIESAAWRGMRRPTASRRLIRGGRRRYGRRGLRHRQSDGTMATSGATHGRTGSVPGQRRAPRRENAIRQPRGARPAGRAGPARTPAPGCAHSPACICRRAAGTPPSDGSGARRARRRGPRSARRRSGCASRSCRRRPRQARACR